MDPNAPFCITIVTNGGHTTFETGYSTALRSMNMLLDKMKEGGDFFNVEYSDFKIRVAIKVSSVDLVYIHPPYRAPKEPTFKEKIEEVKKLMDSDESDGWKKE